MSDAYTSCHRDLYLDQLAGIGNMRRTSDLGEHAAREEIAEAFALMRTLPAAKVALPCAQNNDSGGTRIGTRTLEEAILDGLDYDECQAQLLEVLQFSDCPHVQLLRQRLCARYQRMQAADIAEARE